MRISESRFTAFLGDFILKILNLLHVSIQYPNMLMRSKHLSHYLHGRNVASRRCTKLQSIVIVTQKDKSLQWSGSNEVDVELEQSLDAVGGVLVAGVQRLDGGESLGVLVLAGAPDDGDM